MERYPDGYIAVVEGAIPTTGDGMSCTVGGRPIRDVVREVCDGALATIGVGSCAFDGGLPAAAGGSTGAVGVAQVVPGDRLISLPGCPVNVENLTATLVHYLTFKQLPVADSMHRPLFAYGGLVHNQCERRAHFEFGEFSTAWGDEAAQKGWCLYKMGCKGPETFANCPTALYAERTSWAVKAGHGCIGCTMPRFWDAMGPAYRRLPSPIPFASEVTADQVGAVLVGGVGALTVAHGAASYVRERRVQAAEHRGALAAAAIAAGVAAEAAPAMDLPPIEPPVAGLGSTDPPATDPPATDPPATDPPPAEVTPSATEPPGESSAAAGTRYEPPPAKLPVEPAPAEVPAELPTEPAAADGPADPEAAR
jgi:hydrogenase small subunit